MPVESKSKKPRYSISLTATLTIAFIIFSVLPLLLIGSLTTVRNFQAQQAIASSQQRKTAQQAVNTVSSFLDEKFSILETAAQIEDPFSATVEDQQILLDNLLGLEPSFREVTLLNDRGQEVAKRSRLSLITSDELIDRANSDLFIQTTQNVNYLGSVYIDEVTSEPLITMAVPIKDVFGRFEGVLIAEVNLKFMWTLVNSLEIGREGVAYVVDWKGNLIAFGDISRVLGGENVNHLAPVNQFTKNRGAPEPGVSQLAPGINDNTVLSTYVPLGRPDWAAVVELPVAEAYRAVFIETGLSAIAVLVVAVVAGMSGAYVSRRLATPVQNLTETATSIAQGQFNLEAPVEGTAEVSRLATAFNSMTHQLRELIQSLEDRVAARTQRLELVATLSEQLSAILDFDQLLSELVNQVKTTFGYYHTHVYILDENSQNLVMTAGAGEPGKAMKAAGHSIPLNAPTSLVARAARLGEIVWVDNVREADDWLPNPLLPDTYSEMAVPIMLGDDVVGVLDVQENKVAGLDEGDAGLLRSLANQVAVAIRNARLFADVENALSEAHALQSRYITQAWEKVQRTQQSAEYSYHRPGAPMLDEAVTTWLEQEALHQTQPTVVPLNNKGQQHGDAAANDDLAEQPADALDSNVQNAVIAPIKLQDQVIGTIQLHEIQRKREWSEQELALIQTVAEQVAQMAENMRLFDETRERAGREQTIREITDKLRTAPNLERLLEIATLELSQRLSATHAELELGIEVEPTPAGNGQNE